MDYNINLLHVGSTDTHFNYIFSPMVNWIHISPSEIKDVPARIKEGILPHFEVVFTEESLPELKEIEESIDSYSLVVSPEKMTDLSQDFLLFVMQKKGYIIERESIADFFLHIEQRFFGGQYGARLHIDAADISGRFVKKITYDGRKRVSLEGDFGDEWSSLVTWRYNVPLEKGEPLELWLEYDADDSVDLRLVVRNVQGGSTDKVTFTKVFEEALRDSSKTILLENYLGRGILSISLQAKGKGRVSVGSLHYRYSHLGFGVLKTGATKKEDSARGEIISYFDPMDRKPPLCVYFSGYRTAEGFEGYNMMKSMGAPFLLLADLRLEGGAFYVGGDYEEKVKEIISEALGSLGFTNKELVISGISMGSTGALYYSADFLPHSVIVGKPLANLGNIADNEKYHRPGGFPTSLDVLHSLTGGLDEEDIKKCNELFWKKIDSADFSDTRFAISYMREDDYDLTGYEDLVGHLAQKEITIYGKGMTGRHNDNTAGVVEWFRSRYMRVLKDSFGRGSDNG